MSTAAWVVAVVAVWVVLSGPAGLLLGWVLRRARHAQTTPAAPVRRWEEKHHV